MLKNALALFCFAGQAIFWGQTPREIIMKAAANLSEDSKALRRGFSHQEIEILEVLKDGIVTKRTDKVLFVFGQGERLFQKLVSKNNLPVDNARPEPKREFVALDEKLFNRYEYEFEGTGIEILDGKKYRVISAKPGKNLTEETKIDRLLNNLGMRIWVDAENFNFHQLTAGLLNRVEYAWPGFIGGKVYQIDIKIETAIVNGHTTIKQVRLEYAYSARAMFWPVNNHQIRTVRYENYERRATP